MPLPWEVEDRGEIGEWSSSWEEEVVGRLWAVGPAGKR